MTDVSSDALKEFADRPLVRPVLDEALGRAPLEEPIEPGTGGPAGNARLTSFVGLAILVVAAAEIVTTLNVSGLLPWHVGIGLTLLVLVLAKTSTTSYKIVRYYTGNEVYRRVGPPPTFLRILGPFLMIAALGGVFSGLTLVLMGQARATRTLATIVGQRIDYVSFHQGFIWVFVLLASVHLFARLVPALRRVRRSASLVPGQWWRAAFLLAVAVTAIAVVVWGLNHLSNWGISPVFG